MGPMMPMEPNNNNDIITFLLSVIIVLLLLIIIYLWYSQNKKPTSVKETAPETPEEVDVDKVEVVLKLLNDNEKRIFQAIIENGGEMLQKDISYELDLTRVQTHRAVQSLIERELVKTEPHFNTNKITINDWVTE
jgi:uncharacterized membrane protein